MSLSQMDGDGCWDEIDLSSRERRREKIEILMCQKAQTGDDIKQCLMALQYYTLSKLRETSEQKQTTRYEFYQFKKRIILFLTVVLCALLGLETVQNVVNQVNIHTSQRCR